jgi:hypothetical protein
MALHSARMSSLHHRKERQMRGPAKNRLHDYEAGWLTLLVDMGVATRQEAEDAMRRVAQAAIDQIEEKRKRRQERKKRRPE